MEEEDNEEYESLLCCPQCNGYLLAVTMEFEYLCLDCDIQVLPPQTSIN